MKKNILFVMLMIVLFFPMYPQEEAFRPTIAETTFSGVVGSGARAFGMGGAFIAIADDATAASWNPGGLGQLEVPEFTLVTRAERYLKLRPASYDFQTYQGAMDLEGLAASFDFVSFTFPFKLGKLKLVPQVSYQRILSYDLQSTMNKVPTNTRTYIEARDTYRVRSGSFTESQDYEGGLDTVSFSLATTFFRKFHVGVSVNYWFNGFQGQLLRNGDYQTYFEDAPADISEIALDVRQNFQLDITGININVGLLVAFSERFKLGIVYKSSFNATVDYGSFLPEVGPGKNEDDPNENEMTEGTSTLKWPGTLGIGVSFLPISQLTISADITATRWSEAILEDFQLTRNFNKVDFYFPTLMPVTDRISEGNIKPMKQMDTVQLRFGVEYLFVGRKTLIPLRFGFFVDSQYYPDSSGKNVTFSGFTAGTGIKWGRFSTDLAVTVESGSYLGDNYDYTNTRFSDVRTYLSTSYSF
ncbi:MAG: hypothetical protein GY765_43275 [bacterium]|nr:hypothetical protein [bacterium]